MSQTVKGLVAGSGLSFEGVGEHALKGVPDRWRLYRTDPSTTDAERQRWNVPPLGQAQERAEEMNRNRPVDDLS